MAGESEISASQVQKKLIWTRSIRDWREDQVLLEKRGLDQELLLHLPCLHLKAIEPTIELTQQPKLADDQHHVVITSVNALRFIFQSKQLKALLENAAVIHTHSPKVSQSLKNTESAARIRLYSELRTAAELGKKLKEILPPDSVVISLGAKEPAFDLASFLVTSGIDCQHLACYETEVKLTLPGGQALSPETKTLLAKHLSGVVCFASTSAVNGFVSTLTSDATSERAWLKRLQVVTLGPTTTAAARKFFTHIKECPVNDLPTFIDLAAATFASAFI